MIHRYRITSYHITYRIIKTLDPPAPIPTARILTRAEVKSSQHPVFQAFTPSKVLERPYRTTNNTIAYKFSAASLKTLSRLTAAPPMPAAVRFDVHLFFFSRSNSLSKFLLLGLLLGLLDMGGTSTGAR